MLFFLSVKFILHSVFFYESATKLCYLGPPASCDPLTRLPRLLGQILLSVHMEISARSTGMKLLLRNTTKLMELKLLSFETVVALWTVITLLIKLLIFAYS